MKKKDTKGKAPAALKVVKDGNGNGHDEQGGIDFEAVRVLARIATEFDLAEIEADREGRVRVRRGGAEVAVAAPSPEAPVFVEAGQSVRKGQVVCIVEAMKLMNEIEAECAGTVVDIFAQNGKSVEYGQKLFRIKKA